MNNQIHLKQPEKIFIVIAVTFGLLFALIIAPFHAEAEHQHFYRSYQISEGKIIADKQIVDCYGHQFETYLASTTCVGGMLPKSILTTAKITAGIQIRQTPLKKQNIKDVIALLNLPLDSNNRIFIRFPNASLYFPLPYFPQALGMAIGRIFNFSPLVLLYLGRIVNLLIWLLLVYLAIKITPIYKWLLVLLALTPMSLYQAASLSADALTNGLAFLLIAFIFKSAFKQQQITKLNLLVIVLLSLLLSLSKLAYWSIIFLFLVIPVKNFARKRQYFLTFIGVSVLSLAAVISWLIITQHLNVPLRLDAPNVSTGERFIYIVNHPWKLLFLIGNTLYVYGLNYLEQFIGGLGWGETKLPLWHVVSYGLVLVGVALYSHQKDVFVSPQQKLVSLIVAVVNIGLIFTLLYLTWTSLDSNVIHGIQGRYFIPVAPLLFLLFYNQKIKVNFKNASPATACYLLFSQTLTVAVLLNRYWL